MTSIDGTTDFPGAGIAVPRPPAPAPAALDSFSYDDAIVRKFMVATFVWGLVGMLVGLVIALQLAYPALNLAPWFSFGRLRPLHTNAVIFAFAGNAFFTGVLLLDAAAAARRGCSRDALEPLPLLGLAADHRRRGDHAAARLHAGQGVRRARVADRHRDRGRLGRRSR